MIRCVLTLLVLCSIVFDARADGAIAVGGTLFGISVNSESSEDAEQDALKKCGKNCKVVAKITEGCVAFYSGKDAYGWAVRPTIEEAQFSAMQLCRQNGDDCVKRSVQCESKELSSGAIAAIEKAKSYLSGRVPDGVIDIPVGHQVVVYKIATFNFK